MANPYKTLGVKPDATKAEIKSAFKRLAKELHSDKGGDDDAFVEIRRAHDVLMDDKAREAYDKYGVLPGDEESTLTMAAVKEIGNLFLAVLNSIPPEVLIATDIVERMREIVKEKAGSLRQQVAAISEKSETSAKLRIEIAARLKCKEKKAPEIMLSALDAMIAQLPGQKLMAESGLRHVERMLEILKDYTFRSDPLRHYAVPFGQIMTISSPGWTGYER